MNKTLLVSLLLIPLVGFSQKDTTVINDKVFSVVEEMPQFPQGEQGMFNYIGKTLKYPQEAIDSNIRGIVYISFIVCKDSLIRDIQVIRSVHPLLDKEAVRVISEMPKWNPGKQRKKAVDVLFNLPIHFFLRDKRLDDNPTPRAFIEPHLFHYKEANLKYKSKEYRNAIKDYTTAILHNSSYFEAYYERANCKYRIGEYEGALDDYMTCIKLDPMHVNSINNAASMYSFLKDDKKSEEYYSKALLVDDENIYTLFYRGNIRQRLKDFSGAINDFNRVIHLSKTSNNKYFKSILDIVYDKKSQVYCDMELYEESILALNKAIKFNSNNPELIYERGKSKFMLRNYKSSLKDYNKAIKIKGDNSKYYFDRGMCHFELGDKKTACIDWNKCKELGDKAALVHIKKHCKE